jgi:hypothetical protein
VETISNFTSTQQSRRPIMDQANGFASVAPIAMQVWGK